MKLTCVYAVIICTALLTVSPGTGAAEHSERWTYGPWQTQDMISLGNEILVVDFGRNGLWSYDGTWLRISHLDPLRMITWGESRLVVDFGSHGLWTFDLSRWQKISL